MAEKTPKPTMTILYWGGFAVAIIAFGIWCVLDGWFHEGYEHADANKLMAVGSFVGVAYVLWLGFKEYRKESERLRAANRPTADQGPADSSKP
jgi:threonine/homoserine/homoserine lactone efflux protein